MTYFGTKDYLLQVERGLVSGASIHHGSGRAVVVSSSFKVLSGLTISGVGALSVHITAATKVRYKAGNANNDADPAIGAQGVLVEGIDATGVEISETVDTNGTSAGSDSTLSFLRVNRISCGAVGAVGGCNQGSLVIQNAAGTLDMSTIDSVIGQSFNGWYTIPLNKTGYLLRMQAQTAEALPIRLLAFKKENILDVSVPTTGKVCLAYWQDMSERIVWDPEGAVKLPGLTDFWFETFGEGAASVISMTFDILLIDD